MCVQTNVSIVFLLFSFSSIDFIIGIIALSFGNQFAASPLLVSFLFIGGIYLVLLSLSYSGFIAELHAREAEHHG